jgi:hypothetical protein
MSLVLSGNWKKLNRQSNLIIRILATLRKKRYKEAVQYLKIIPSKPTVN